MANTSSPYFQNTCTVVLAASQNADATHMDVSGARAVAWTVTCDKTDQLTAALPQVLFTDGKQANITPGAFTAGTDSVTTNLNAAGVITTADLSTTTPRIVLLRCALGSNSVEKMYGAKNAWLTLTKAATAGNATYTVTTTVYY